MSVIAATTNRTDNAPLSDRITSVLKQYWGYSQFRPLQKEAVECVLHNKDSIVVLPTGGGKSICYQAPAMLKPGLAIVISPLISLMKDQVDALRECGIPAARLDSTLHPMEIENVFDDIRQNKLKLLYTSPERLFSAGFLDFIQTLNVSFIAIDEAHCVSFWGHDFRPEYRQLGKLKELFPTLTVHAYTATATEQVRSDISIQLKLKHPSILVGSFDRPNLIYKLERREDITAQVTEVIDRHPNESGIIYCIRRADVDGMCAELNRAGYNALPYHAGMNDAERKHNQDAFIKEKVNIIVATVAFGMGIDKSNVRYVIHTGMPKSLEHYQQESGRAGRDGLDAECCLFYSGGDFGTWKSIMRDTPVDAKKIAEKKLSAMYDFCTGVSCRHKAIVQYFGQQFDQPNCYACDVCLGGMEPVKDGLVIAQKILSCIKRLDEKFGADYTADVLTGSKNQRILSNRHDQLSTYNILPDTPKPVVRNWTEQLVSQGYAIKDSEYGMLQVTQKGWQVLKGLETPKLLQPNVKKSKAKLKSKLTDDWAGVDSGLMEELRQLHRDIANEKEVPAFVVFSDAALRDMARYRPTTIDLFRTMNGVGEKKCNEYGKTFTGRIKQYCQTHSIDVNIKSMDTKKTDSGNTIKQKHATIPNQTKREAFQHFQQGKSIATAAKLLNKAESTVFKYLTEYLQQECVTDSSPWVDEPVQQKIIKAAHASEDGRLKPIYEALNEEISYDDIRIVITCFRNLEHFKIG